MKPWLNCPPCPKGCGKIGLPISQAYNGHGGPRDSTLFCPACGNGWVGALEQVAQAEKAQASWERKCHRDKSAKARRDKHEALAGRVAAARKVSP